MRDYEFYFTQDGSVGLYSYADDDVYHSKFGALTEAWHKFVLPSGIRKILNKQEDIRVLDLCYGIGYNTKALMSYVINSDENILKNKNNFKNKIKNNLKNFGKYLADKYNIDTIDINKINNPLIKLLLSIETNNIILSKIELDCLDINEELIKISPFVKTLLTPQEIYTMIVPKIFDCFDLYWKIKKLISKISFNFMPQNLKKITEKLNLKFNNDYDDLDKEYKIHKFVNLIIIDTLFNKYGENYYNKKLADFLSAKRNRRYFDKKLIKYARLKHKTRYNFISRVNLFTNLHNIYYDYLSKRYKNAKYKAVNELFKLNYYPNDARKTILQLNCKYDLMFLDAFTYSKAPELWTDEFIAELYNRLSPRGIILTYSNSALVRGSFIENGFYVGKIIDDKTGKFIGTVATKEKTLIEHPLSNYELGLCTTKAGIPYHDYGLSTSREEILKMREIEFKKSDRLTSSQYIKHRTLKTGNFDDDKE